MYEQNVFQILEIEPTDDVRLIKKAYAGLVKKYHPEEYPEKWQEIHDAYETALKIAEQKGVAAGMQLEVKTQEKFLQPHEEEASPERREADALFENVESLSTEQQRKNIEIKPEDLMDVMRSLKIMETKKKFAMEEWEAFFNRENIIPIISRPACLEQFGKCFVNKFINKKLYRYLRGQVQLIKQYCEDNHLNDKMAKTNFLAYAESRVNKAYMDKYAYIFIPIISVLMVFFLRRVYYQPVVGNNGNYSAKEQGNFDGSEQMSYQPYDVMSRFWTDESILQFVLSFMEEDNVNQDFYKTLLQESMDEADVLQDGLAVWDWTSLMSAIREKVSYEIHEIPAADTIKSQYHLKAFCITSDSEQKGKILLCDLETLGFREDCRIYYDNGEKYVEIPVKTDFDGEEISDAKCRCGLLGYQALVIETHLYDEQNLNPVIIVEPLDPADMQMQNMEEEELQLFLEQALLQS